MSWNNQGGGPWRSPGRGPWGQGPAGPSDRRPRRDHPSCAGGPRQAHSPRAGERQRQRARQPRCPARGSGRAPAVVRVGNVLHRPAERDRHQPCAWPLHRQDGRRPQHQLALAHRLGDQGSGLGSADHRDRLPQPRGKHGYSRGKPDAYRRQEHCRRPFPGGLADRSGKARRLRVQYSQSARDGQGGRPRASCAKSSA